MQNAIKDTSPVWRAICVTHWVAIYVKHSKLISVGKLPKKAAAYLSSRHEAAHRFWKRADLSAFHVLITSMCVWRVRLMLNINACLNKTAELRLFLIVLFLLSSMFCFAFLLSTFFSSPNKGRSLYPLRNILPASHPVLLLLLTVSLFFPLPSSSINLSFSLCHTICSHSLHLFYSPSHHRFTGMNTLMQYFCFQCGKSQPIRLYFLINICLCGAEF